MRPTQERAPTSWRCTLQRVAECGLWSAKLCSQRTKRPPSGTLNTHESSVHSNTSSTRGCLPVCIPVSMYLMDQFSWTPDIIETLSIYKTYIGVDHWQRQQHGEQPHQQQRLPGHGGAEIRAEDVEFNFRDFSMDFPLCEVVENSDWSNVRIHSFYIDKQVLNYSISIWYSISTVFIFIFRSDRISSFYIVG